MATRHSERFYRLIGKIGTSRLVSRIHPPLDRRIPVIALEPVEA